MFAFNLAARAPLPDEVDSSGLALFRDARPFAVRVRLAGAGGSGSTSESDSESSSTALLSEGLGLGFFAGAARFLFTGLGGLGRER